LVLLSISFKIWLYSLKINFKLLLGLWAFLFKNRTTVFVPGSFQMFHFPVLTNRETIIQDYFQGLILHGGGLIMGSIIREFGGGLGQEGNHLFQAIPIRLYKAWCGSFSNLNGKALALIHFSGISGGFNFPR